MSVIKDEATLFSSSSSLPGDHIIPSEERRYNDQCIAYPPVDRDPGPEVSSGDAATLFSSSSYLPLDCPYPPVDRDPGPEVSSGDEHGALMEFCPL